MILEPLCNYLKECECDTAPEPGEAHGYGICIQFP